MRGSRAHELPSPSPTEQQQRRYASLHSHALRLHPVWHPGLQPHVNTAGWTHGCKKAVVRLLQSVGSKRARERRLLVRGDAGRAAQGYRACCTGLRTFTSSGDE